MTFTPEHIFTNQTPTLTNVTDAHGVTIGTKFRASVDGQITGIRWFYPTTLPASAAQGVLYSYTSETSGTSLATATFSSPTAGAWNTVTFGSPVNITAGTVYVAAVWSSDHYVATTSGIASDIANGHLTAISDSPGTGFRNGTFDESAGSVTGPTYPASHAANPANYFVDVTFVPTTHDDTGTGTEGTSKVSILKVTTDTASGTDASRLNREFFTGDSGLGTEASILSVVSPSLPIAEGPLTIPSLVDEVLDVVHGYVRGQESKTHLTSVLGASDLTFSVATPKAVSLGLVEVGDELIYVSMVNQSNGIATIEPWGRAQSSTQAVAHAVNTRVINNPVFPRQRVRNVVWGVLREMFPDVFATAETFLDINPALTHYDMPSDCYHVMQVQWLLPGPTHMWAEANRWKQNKRSGSPVELELFSRVWPGNGRARVQYMKNPPDEFGVFDDLGGYGYDLQVRDLIVIGSAARLLAYVESSRVLTESVVANGRAEAVPAGSATAASKYLYSVFQKRLADERTQQQFRHPTQIHFTR